MRRLVLIDKCVSGEIHGEEYKKLCADFPWLKKNVDLRGESAWLEKTIDAKKTSSTLKKGAGPKHKRGGVK